MSYLFGGESQQSRYQTAQDLNEASFNKDDFEPALSDVSLTGSALAVPRIAARSVANLGLAADSIPTAIGTYYGINNPWWHKHVTESLIHTSEALTPDPKNTHVALQVVDGLVGMLSDFAISGFNPVGYGAMQAGKRATLELEQGKSLGTALDLGTVDGLMGAALTAAPMGVASKAIKLPARVQGGISGIGLGAGLGAIGETANQQVLESAGYPEEAKLRDWADPQTLGLNAAFGLVFGAWHPKILSSHKDALLTVNEAHAIQNPDGLSATHPAANNALVDNMNSAVHALANDKPVTSALNISRKPDIPEELIALAGERMSRGERQPLEQQRADLEFKLKQIEEGDYMQQGIDRATEQQALLDADNQGRLVITGRRVPARKLADQRKKSQEAATALGEEVRTEDAQPLRDSLNRLNETLGKDDQHRAAHAEISRLEQQHLLDNGFITHPEVKQRYEAALHEEVQAAIKESQPAKQAPRAAPKTEQPASITSSIREALHKLSALPQGWHLTDYIKDTIAGKEPNTTKYDALSADEKIVVDGFIAQARQLKDRNIMADAAQKVDNKASDLYAQLTQEGRINLDKALQERLDDFAKHEVKPANLKISDLIDQQFGEDMFNASSENTANDINQAESYSDIPRPEDLLPIIVSTNGTILDGHHRVAAAIKNGYTTIHALVEQPAKVEAVQESPTMDMGEPGFISETTQTIDAKDTALADSNEFGDKSDIAMGQPTFKGNKRSMLGMAVNAIKTLINRLEITHIDDWFAGGGMWSTSLANAILPNVKSIRLGELNPLRIKRIEWMHERGDKLFEDMQSSGALEVYRKLLEEFKNNKDTDGSAKPIVSPSPFDKIGLELAGFGTGKGVGFDRVRTSGADKLPEQGKVLLSALGDLAFNNRGVKIHEASQMTLPDGTVADKFLAKAITEMAAAHKQAQAFKSRGGKYEYMPAGSSFDSVGSKVIKGKHVLSLADPPYYNTTGYKGAGDFATGDKWNAKGYAATHDLLQTLVANDNHILYTDEAWWRNPEQMADKHAAGATLTKINNMLSDLHVAPKQIGNRYEQLGIHNPTHASGQTDSSGLGGKIYAGTAGKGTDGGGRGDDSGRATGPMAEGTGEQGRVATKLLKSPEITAARESIPDIPADKLFEIEHDDGSTDTGSAAELMARADQEAAFAEQSDTATSSAITCFLKFGDL